MVTQRRYQKIIEESPAPNIDLSINMDKLDLGGSTLDLLSFENNGNMSIDFEKFSEKLTLSTDESDIYWSYFIFCCHK